MRTPPRPGPLRRTAQRGAALLIALLTVTLVATFAATALWQQWRVTEIEAAERARLQSAWVLVGALDWARLALREDRDRERDDLTEPWAIPLAEARLSSFLAADKNVASDELAGLPDAFLSGQITDAQSKLNVRNLVQGGQPAKASVEAFERLFEMLGLPPEQVMLMVRGLTQALPVTTTGTPSPESPAPLAPNPEGAADAPLMPQRLPQLAWFGLPASTIAVITPYVTLLPSGSNAATAININTASAEVMAAALPGLDLAGAQRVLARRQGQPFAKLSEADELLPEENVRFTASGLFDVKSSFFETVGRLRLDKHWVEEHALVQRSTTHLTVIWRERGAGATLNPSGS